MTRVTSNQLTQMSRLLLSPMTIQTEVDAWHEAGHVAVGTRLGRILDFVTIARTEIPSGMYKGKPAQALTQWKGHILTNARQVPLPLVDVLAEDLAGAWVEAHVFPDHDSCWTGDTRLIIFHCWRALAQSGETPQVSDEAVFELIRADRVPQEIADFVDEQENLAFEKLSVMFRSDSNLWSDVRRISEALMKHKRLSGTDVNVLIHARMGRNDPCPCGSGKKYKKCHGGPN